MRGDAVCSNTAVLLVRARPERISQRRASASTRYVQSALQTLYAVRYITKCKLGLQRDARLELCLGFKQAYVEEIDGSRYLHFRAFSDRRSRRVASGHSRVNTVGLQRESKKSPPLKFSDIFRKRLGIFSPNFTHLLCVHICAGLQVCIQLSATLTKYADDRFREIGISNDLTPKQRSAIKTMIADAKKTMQITARKTRKTFGSQWQDMDKKRE